MQARIRINPACFPMVLVGSLFLAASIANVAQGRVVLGILGILGSTVQLAAYVPSWLWGRMTPDVDAAVELDMTASEFFPALGVTGAAIGVAVSGPMPSPYLVRRRKPVPFCFTEPTFLGLLTTRQRRAYCALFLTETLATPTSWLTRLAKLGVAIIAIGCAVLAVVFGGNSAGAWLLNVYSLYAFGSWVFVAALGALGAAAAATHYSGIDARAAAMSGDPTATAEVIEIMRQWRSSYISRLTPWRKVGMAAMTLGFRSFAEEDRVRRLRGPQAPS